MEPVFEFPLDLEKGGGKSRAHRLHQQLRAAIVARRLPPGSPLPATRRVAEAYGVARNTVVAAYDLLAAEGYVIARPGAKAVVANLGQGRAVAARKRLPPAMPSGAAALPASRPVGIDAPTHGFHIGVPDHRRFPLDVWRRLLARSLKSHDASAFGYQAPYGRPLLRAAIAQHAASARAVACREDDVLVTSGAQQAFDLLARVLVAHGRTKVAVEEPGYPPMRRALLAAGAQLVPVPVDDEGLCVDALPAGLRAVCVTPSHQFPTGVPMSMARRHALLDFARRHGAVIIEDDYDCEFRYGSQPLDALQTIDLDGNVIYVGTFSKSLFPSLRLGYVIAPQWAREALAAARQWADTAGNAQLQDALARFILDGHLAQHVRRMRKIYEGRREALLDGLDRYLRDWLEPLPAQAGIHLCTRYRDRRQASRILSSVRQHANGAQPVSDFLLAAGTTTASGIAFGFGCIEADEIARALSSVARALRRG
ncbi:PLP-dependent aminotransferase family protein [Trinickia terrae]|uniref:PLP-dependent aminotransferase family protein n=1 Tax=Trinickia terrae TaxID=2571161 RepID=A0A4U1IDF9_9BURK|nr:PLP-dependent aminotransferase family protein [Trinickia terrae]TKC91671.1 PLP-dependent aminotransferase family protein [Trinickia terrae]